MAHAKHCKPPATHEERAAENDQLVQAFKLITQALEDLPRHLQPRVVRSVAALYDVRSL